MDKSRVAVFEKAFSLQPIGAAIGLFPNGFAALDEISPNAVSKVRDSMMPHNISRMFDLDGTTLVRETDFSKLSIVSPKYLVWYLLQQYLREDLEDMDTSVDISATSKTDHGKEESSAKTLHLGHIVTSCSVDDVTGIVTVSIDRHVHIKLVNPKTQAILTMQPNHLSKRVA